MAGLDPAIYVLLARKKGVEAGHYGGKVTLEGVSAN
jgi:hypothetical protein